MRTATLSFLDRNDTPIYSVDEGEEYRLLSTIRWLHDLQLESNI